jgi:hypothetical protein
MKPMALILLLLAGAVQALELYTLPANMQN